MKGRHVIGCGQKEVSSRPTSTQQVRAEKANSALKMCKYFWPTLAAAAAAAEGKTPAVGYASIIAATLP